jgi:acyl-CoA synthetase (NDP forming)
LKNARVEPARADDTVQAIRAGIADARAAGGAGKPVLACLMAGHGRKLPLAVADERIPTFAFPENAARALARAVTYAEWRATPPALFWNFEDIRVDDARATCRRSIAAHGDGWLSNQDVAAVLGAFGVTLAAGMMAHCADEAVAHAERLGLPVAAKLAARSVTHKSDIGAVRLNLASDAAVRRAYSEIAARAAQIDGAETDGVLIQQMAVGGVETMIGISDDPLFGPLIGFGLGGVHVEVLGDVRFRIAPLSGRDADELLHEIKGLPLLEGYRGRPPADFGALRELLLRVSRLAIEVPEIAELDLNPVIAMSPGNGCRIVDARIKVRSIA